MNSNTRKILILVGAIDAFLSGIVFLIYFSFLLIDISDWDISRGTIGLVGGVWFLGALGVLITS